MPATLDKISSVRAACASPSAAANSVLEARRHLKERAPSVADALLFSARGAERLSALAADLEGAADLLPLAADLRLAAWEYDLLNGKAAAKITSLPAPAAVSALAAFVAAAKPEDPEAQRAFDLFYLQSDIKSLKKFLAARAGNPYWLRFAWQIGIQQGHTDFFSPYPALRDLPAPLRKALAADLSFALGDWAKAAGLYSLAHRDLPLSVFKEREGECLLRQGRATEAAALWFSEVLRRPWRPDLFLRAFWAAAPELFAADCFALRAALPAGRGAVLLYTWNHDRDLDAALASLAASLSLLVPEESARLHVVALDNGSLDGTPEILRKWQERLPQTLSVVTLPVNVGAPAARNWLLSLPEVRACDWVIFLDDDAIVPPDWLASFAAALSAYPKAQIVGCRIVESLSPLAVQTTDLHLAGGRGAGAPGDAAFEILNAHHMVADFGEYSYMRPCASASGCCHLFTRAGIENTGGFDLRFTPSQYDDLERDLRSCLKGAFPVFQGGLRVRHRKRSSLKESMTPQQLAQSKGNWKKLEKTYSMDDIRQIQAGDLQNLEEDLAKRARQLASGGA